MPKKRRLFSTRGQTILKSNDYKKSKQGKIIPLERKSTSELRSNKNPTELKSHRLQRKDLKLNVKKIFNESKRSIPLKSCLSSHLHGEKLKMKVKFYVKKCNDPFRDRLTHTDSAQNVNNNMRKGKEFVTTHRAGAMVKNKEIGFHRRNMAGDFDIKSKQKQNKEKTAENNYQINETFLKNSLAGKIRNMIVEKSKQLSDTSIRHRHLRKSLEIRSFNSHSSINYDKFKERLNKHCMKYQAVSNNHASKNISTANNSLHGKYKLAPKNNSQHPTVYDRLEMNKQNRQTPNKLSNVNVKNINTLNNYNKGENTEPNLSAVVYQDICVTGRMLKLWKKHSEAKNRRVLSIEIGRKTSNNNISYYSNERNKKSYEVNESKLKEKRQVLDNKSKLENHRKEINIFNKSEQIYQAEVFSELFTQNNKNVMCPEKNARMKRLQEKEPTKQQYWNDHLKSSIREKHDVENLFIKRTRKKVLPHLIKELTDQFPSVAKANRINLEKQGKIITNQTCTSTNDTLRYNLPINKKSTRLKNDGKTGIGHQHTHCNITTAKQLSNDKEQKKSKDAYLKEVNNTKNSSIIIKLWTNVLRKALFSYNLNNNSHFEKHTCKSKKKKLRKNIFENSKQVNSLDKMCPKTDFGKSEYNKRNNNKYARTLKIDEQWTNKFIDKKQKEIANHKNKPINDRKLNKAVKKRLSDEPGNTAKTIKDQIISHEIVAQQLNNYRRQFQGSKYNQQSTMTSDDIFNITMKMSRLSKNISGVHTKNNNQTSDYTDSKQETNFLINRNLSKETKNQKKYNKTVNERNIMLSPKPSKTVKKNERHSQNISLEIDSLLSNLMMNRAPCSEHSELPNKISAYPNKATNDLQIRNYHVQNESKNISNWWTKFKEQIKHTYRQIDQPEKTSKKQKHFKAPVSSTKYISSSDRISKTKFTNMVKETKPKNSLTDNKNLETKYGLSKNNPSVKETKSILPNQNKIMTDSLHKQHTEHLFLSESRLNEIKEQIISECKKALFEFKPLKKQHREIERPSATDSVSNRKLNNSQQSKFLGEPKTTCNYAICEGKLFKIEPIKINVYKSSIKADERYTAPHLESEKLIMVSDYEQSEHSSRLHKKQTRKSICQKQCSKSDSFLEQNRQTEVLIDQYLKDSKQSVITKCKKSESESLKSKIRSACEKSGPESEAIINQRAKPGHILKCLNNNMCFHVRQIEHTFLGNHKAKSKFNRPFLESKPEKTLLGSGYGVTATSPDTEVPEYVCVINKRTSNSRLNEIKRNVACGSKKRIPKCTTNQKDKCFNSSPRLLNKKINCDACKHSDNTFMKRLRKGKETLKQKKCVYNKLLKDCTCYFKHCDDKSVIDKQLQENKVIQERPFLFIYKMFPRAYPHLLHFMIFAKKTYRFGMALLAYMTWIPWICVGFIAVLILKYIILY